MAMRKMEIIVGWKYTFPILVEEGSGSFLSQLLALPRVVAMKETPMLPMIWIEIRAIDGFAMQNVSMEKQKFSSRDIPNKME